MPLVWDANFLSSARYAYLHTRITKTLTMQYNESDSGHEVESDKNVKW